MMRRHLFFCTAFAALLSAAPSHAQYARYQSSSKPPVEVNLDVLNEIQEQQYRAQTDVVQEPLAVSQPPVMPAQTVEAMPEPQPVTEQAQPVADYVAQPVAPAPKRRLLKPVLTTPVIQTEEEPVAQETAAADTPASGVTPDGEMPMPRAVVKHSVIKSYSPVDDIAQSPAVDEIYRQADMEDMAAAMDEVAKPLPLPRRKPQMGEKKHVAENAPAEPVRMAALSAKAVPMPVIADDVTAPQTDVPAREKAAEPKIEVAALEVAPEVKAEEIKANEAKAEVAKAGEVPVAEAKPDAVPEPVQMAQADIPAPVTAVPARKRIISQPPVMKEQRLQPLQPRTVTGSSKPIVSQPPSVAAPVAPAHPVVGMPSAPVVPRVPKMTAQPVAPVAAAPLEDATPVQAEVPAAIKAPVPVAPVAETAAPVAETAAPVPETAAPDAPRPGLEIVGAPLTDVNAKSEADAAAMPVVPVIDDLTLSFPGNSSDLNGESQKKLDAVINQMAGMGDGRLQVRGYASGEDSSQSSARRIALSRALAVRSYLMDKGIKPTRVDVRALGTESDRQPLDRVDLIFAR